MSQFIQVKDLSKIYSRKKSKPKQALSSINLEIEKGEVFGLLGVNGAGKTTLSSVLAGVLAHSGGDVLLAGASIYRDLPAYRQRVGLCPQKPNLNRDLNLEENLFYSALGYGLSKKEATQACAEIIERFGLDEYLKSNAVVLSGGWRQRFLIARALVHKPQIVILDEPTVGLDPHIRHELWDVIHDLKKAGVTILLTTHYLDEAERLCDRVCMIHDGRVRSIETPKNLKESFKKANLEEVFLEMLKEKGEV